MAIHKNVERAHTAFHADSFDKTNRVLVELNKALEDYTAEEKPAFLLDRLYAKVVPHMKSLKPHSRQYREALEALRKTLLSLRTHADHLPQKRDFDTQFKFGQMMFIAELAEDSLEYLERAQRINREHPDINRIVEMVQQTVQAGQKGGFNTVAENTSNPHVEKYKALCTKAHALMEQEQYSESATLFSQAISMAIREKLPVTSLDRACKNCAEIKRRHLGDAAGALTLAKLAYQLNPGAVENIIEYGYALSANKDFVQAAEKFKEAYKKDPQRTKLVRRVAFNLQNAGDKEGAFAFVQSEHRKNPDDPYILIAMAEQHVFRREFREAISHAAKVHREAPDTMGLKQLLKTLKTKTKWEPRDDNQTKAGASNGGSGSTSNHALRHHGPDFV